MLPKIIQRTIENIVLGIEPTKDDRRSLLDFLMNADTMVGPYHVSSPVFHELRDLCEVNQWIEAIKLLRQETGAGLKESKDAIDATFPRKED